MLRSRNKPGWLRKAQQEVDELWEQHLELADSLEDFQSNKQAQPVYAELDRVKKEIDKAEKNFKKLYSIWDHYLALQVARIQSHKPIVVIDEENLKTVKETVSKKKWNRNEMVAKGI